MNYRKIAAIAACLVIMLTVGLVMNQEHYASAVIIDINPSVRLELDENEIVLSYEALNADAETLDLVPVIGMQVDDAVTYITLAAINAGYLDPADLEEDYVLITTVSDDDQNKQEIRDKIKAAHEADDNLRGVHLALMIAEAKEFEKFGDAGVPPGLLIAAGNMAEKETVKSFFKNEANIEKFELKGEIVPPGFDKQIDKLTAQIEALDLADDEKSALTADFLAAKLDFFEAKALHKEAIKAYQAAVKSGDPDAIAAAKQAMEDAEALKNSFEAQKDTLEEAKDLLTEALEAEEGEEGINPNLDKILEKKEEIAAAKEARDAAKAARDKGNSGAKGN